MSWRSLILIAALIWVALAAPAQAGPVGAAIGAVVSAIKGSVFLSALARIAASYALSRLSQALAPKPRQPGIKTETTASGSQNPASFILGRYATNGVMVCPPMSHGRAGKTPNAYLTYVVELSDVPGAALDGYMINGERVTLGGTAHPDYGFPVVGGTFGGYAWIKYYDGTQTAVDPGLLSIYGAYPERPWSSAMVGRGLCYAICTFRYKRKVYRALPEVRFEMLGHPLYDPRKDSTVGGSGSHRLANPATWERTTNPIIQIFNLHLGQAVGGDVWGGRMPLADLPLGSVFAAANACDALVDNGSGGTEARFRAGFEVFVEDEPASVCEDLLAACLGEVADVGGQWRFQAGDAALPSFFFGDDDLFVTLDRETSPFPSPDDTRNGITASFPNPALQWEPDEAPPVYNATWEAEDGQRRVINVDFPAVPYPAQVQRNMRAMIADDRRFLTHVLPFPPEATVLDPLDTVSWTSSAKGYSAKLFEVTRTGENLRSGVVQINLRERDAADTAVVPGYFTAPGTPSTVPVVPGAQAVPGFAVAGVALTDASGNDRRPALELTWDAADLDGIRGIEYEVRRAGSTALAAKGTTTDIEAGEIVVPEGMLPDTGYEARAKLVSDRETAWTSWLTATTPAALITVQDLGGSQLQTVVLGPLTWGALPNGTVVATLDLGQILPGQGWERRVSFEARKAVATITGFFINLERRRAVLGGALGPWTQQAAYTVDGTAWDVYGSAGTISEPVDDFEYRLVVVQRPDGSAGDQILRNVYITAVRITE